MDWKPQDDFCVRLSDETAMPRTEAALTDMAERIRSVANDYGFDLSVYGSSRAMGHVFDGERDAAIRIEMVKAVRVATGMGLREAQQLAESVIMTVNKARPSESPEDPRIT